MCVCVHVSTESGSKYTAFEQLAVTFSEKWVGVRRREHVIQVSFACLLLL